MANKEKTKAILVGLLTKGFEMIWSTNFSADSESRHMLPLFNDSLDYRHTNILQLNLDQCNGITYSYSSAKHANHIRISIPCCLVQIG